ncbi:DUF6882 domain-containing protein [Kitasatospora aureofaciens]|uniref:DUF6882 domain-containing protein n=1 Tax=Kitasatospora aureofaciens TaxID=1894 RepID=UPI0037C54E5C
MWAWANQSLLPDMSRDSRSFCEWAEANGHPGLAQPEIDADEQTASTLAAPAFRVTGATGYDKGPGATLTEADGSASTFDIDVS